MSKLVELWWQSLGLGSAEDSQRYVYLHLEAVCRRAGLTFWRSSGPPPGLESEVLFLGLAPYDVSDLHFMDVVLAAGGLLGGKFDEVVVFSLADAFSIDQIRGVVPDIDYLGASNPIVASWSDGRCQFAAGGFAARQQVREMLSSFD